VSEASGQAERADEQADAETDAVAAAVAAADKLELSALAPTVENVEAWAAEWRELRAKRHARELELSAPAERQEAKKHEHYARLLKLPRLIDETLATWIDPADDLSDKQLFQELLRMMGLPEAVETRLMRAMVEAVKQHRLRREREEMERGDLTDHGAEMLSLRAGWRSAHPAVLPTADGLVNVGGEGNEYALFLAAFLQAIGARVRLSIGCSRNITLPPPEVDAAAAPWALAAQMATWQTEAAVPVCQLFSEVRLGRNPAKIGAWVRAWLPHSKWLGRRYHYRLDREGYVWLNLDWVDGARLQRPGAPFKPFDTLVTYYPTALLWETDGEEFDSSGVPKPRKAPVESLRMGTR